MVDAGSVGWPGVRPSAEAPLRRILAAFWGVALLGVLLLPMISLPEDLGGAAVPLEPVAARYQRLVLATTGVVSLIGAATGRRVWGWVAVTSMPLLVGLGVWEFAELGGPWWQSWWRPAFGVALVVVPAWLLATTPRSTR